MTTSQHPGHDDPERPAVATANTITPRRYSRYLISIPVGVLLSGLAWLLLVLGQVGAPVESSRWSGELVELKRAAAAAHSGPKLVVMAGSSAMFNIRTKRITEATGVPAVNFGTMVPLQLEYMLWNLKRSLTPGDVVYLPLEYELFICDGIPTRNLLDHVFARDPAYLNSLDLRRRGYHLVSLSWNRLFRGYRALVTPPPPPSTSAPRLRLPGLDPQRARRRDHQCRSAPWRNVFRRSALGADA